MPTLTQMSNTYVDRDPLPTRSPRPVGQADLYSHQGLDLLLWLPRPVLGAGALCRAGRGATGAGHPEAAEGLIGADVRGARIRRILRRRIFCGGLPLGISASAPDLKGLDKHGIQWSRRAPGNHAC